MRTTDVSPLQTQPKFFENCLLVLIGLLAHAPLHYQLPRLANGLDSTFVHPLRIEQSPFPCIMQLAKLHPFWWMLLIVFVFIRICRNYGWRLQR